MLRRRHRQECAAEAAAATSAAAAAAQLPSAAVAGWLWAVAAAGGCKLLPQRAAASFGKTASQKGNVPSLQLLPLPLLPLRLCCRRRHVAGDQNLS